MGQNEAKWNALVKAASADTSRLNKALTCAFAAIQRRDGHLPVRSDPAALEDLYGFAVATYKAPSR